MLYKITAEISSETKKQLQKVYKPTTKVVQKSVALIAPSLFYNHIQIETSFTSTQFSVHFHFFNYVIMSQQPKMKRRVKYINELRLNK
jgi:hypothetical protein